MAIQKINYTDKAQLYTNSDIADTNKVMADDMNEIKNVVNNNADETTTNATLIDNATTYSNTETQIGTWNGKPLYRKIVRITGEGTSGTHTQAHGISNIKRVTNCYGLFGNDNGTSYPPGNNIFNFLINKIDTTDITIYTSDGSFSASWKLDIVLEYTKTTD